MLPLPELVNRLRALPRKELRNIVQATGVPSRTIRNIRNGVTRNPRVGTAQPISEWLESRDH